MNRKVIGATFVVSAIGIGLFVMSQPGIFVARAAGKSNPAKHQEDRRIAANPVVKAQRKPTAAERARYAAIEKDRQENYVSPILSAIKNADAKGVKSLWKRYNLAGFAEDPWLRLQLAKFFVKRGDKQEAHGHLETILYPPKGSWSSLQRSGEVMSLYMETSPSGDRQKKGVVVRDWDARVSAPDGPMANDQNLPAEAKVEWLKAQELEAQSRPSEALESYRKVALLAPKSFFAQKQLGLALTRAGDFTASKQAMIRAYKLAPTKERDSIRRIGRISKQDLRKLGA